MLAENISKAAALIRNSKNVAVFTGAGISVESGIPPFRGPGGLWEKYDPTFIELNYFRVHPHDSWKKMKEIFFDFMAKAEPNAAHFAVAQLERAGHVKAVITQNIDGLHQRAGSTVVYEFHGTIESMRCIDCLGLFPSREIDLSHLPPLCPGCGGLLKPDFVFFGEAIPQEVSRLSFEAAGEAEVLLVIGTTGEVMPAALIPQVAKEARAQIIEINPTESAFTNVLTDIFLKGSACEMMSQLAAEVVSGAS